MNKYTTSQAIIISLTAGALAASVLYLLNEAVHGEHLSAFRAGLERVDRACVETGGDHVAIIPDGPRNMWYCRQYLTSGAVVTAVIKMEKDGDAYKITVRK